MIVLTLTNVHLNDGVTIVHTDYEIATDPNMENIIRYSYNDTVDKYMKSFDIDLEDGRTYYGRVRCMLSTGPLDYGDIIELKYTEENDVFSVLPAPIETPVIITGYSKQEHPYGNFTVMSSEFKSIGDSKITRSYWIVKEVITGKVVDFERKTSVMNYYTCSKILKPKTQYEIGVIYKSNGQNWSKKGTIIITTGACLTNNSVLNMVTTENDTFIPKVATDEVTSKHSWFLYDRYANQINPESSETSVVSGITIDKSWLENGETYTLMGKELYPDGSDSEWKYLIFRTTPNNIYGLPNEFPYKLGTGAEEDSDRDVDNTKE